MLERDYTRKVLPKYVQERGAHYIRFPDHGYRGTTYLPCDGLIVKRYSNVIFVEVKIENAKLTKSQLKFAETIRPFAAFVILRIYENRATLSRISITGEEELLASYNSLGFLLDDLIYEKGHRALSEKVHSARV